MKIAIAELRNFSNVAFSNLYSAIHRAAGGALGRYNTAPMLLQPLPRKRDTDNMERWAVIWDVDGTLVDTAELHFQAWCALSRELGQPFTRADFAGTFGWRNPEIIPKLFTGPFTAADVDRLGTRKEDLYRAEASKGVDLLPGVRGLLTDLAAAGCRQAIGSSAPRRNLDLIVAITDTASFFSAIVSMEDTQRGKPDPQVFLIAAEKLGVPPKRCVVLEDAPVGVQAARAGGMKAVGVTFVGHHSVAKLEAAGANLVVPSLERVGVSALQALLGPPID
jgi:beta-phosphoglucomutase